jgi:hypothetical protein
MEEWNDGTLEYWVKKKHFYNIPSFQYSRYILVVF